MTAKKPATKRQRPREPEVDVLARLLEQYGATGLKGKLHRVDDKSRKLKYLEVIEPITEDLEEYLKEKHGGGEYKVHIFLNNEYQPGKSLDFAIEGRPKTHETATAPAVPAKSGIDVATDMLTKAAPFAAAVASVITAIGALMPKRESSGSSAAELLNTALAAEARGEQRGIELGTLKARSNGNGSSGGTMMDVAERFIPPLLELAANRRGNPGTLPVPRQEVAPVQAPKALTPADPANDPAYAWLTAIRPYLPHLVGEAQRDAAPGVVMEYALSRMPPAILHAIDAAVKRDDFRAVMRAELAPHLQAYPDWADEFVAELIDFAQNGQQGSEVQPPAQPAAKRGRGKA